MGVIFCPWNQRKSVSPGCMDTPTALLHMELAGSQEYWPGSEGEEMILGSDFYYYLSLYSFIVYLFRLFLGTNESVDCVNL